MEALRHRGFLIVETFERLYEDFRKPWEGPGDFYGIPKKGVPASQAKKRYRGIDRFPLEPYSDQDVEKFGDLASARREADAQRLLDRLETSERAFNNYVQAIDDVRSALALLSEPSDFELIWARDYLFDEAPPPGSSLLGYEPSYFRPDHFSAIADCMFFPAGTVRTRRVLPFAPTSTR